MRSFDTYKVADEHSGLTVEAYLKQILQYSGRKIQKLTRAKGLFLNGRSVYLQRKVKGNDMLKVLVLEDSSYGVQPEEGPVDILYEDKHLWIINKPAYQLVHPTGQTTKGTLANFLAGHLQARGVFSAIRPLHRLDRETSGCVIFAKDARSQFILEQQLRDGSLKRDYVALVQGTVEPPTGTIDAPIGAHATHPNRRAVDKRGEPAVTHYRRVDTFNDVSLLELELETGRTHQIRVHLSHLGYPILGDRMYGARSPLISRQALHAASVALNNLTDNHPVTVHAPLPNDLTRAIQSLKQ